MAGKSRPARWTEAVNEGRKAYEEIETLMQTINDDLADEFRILWEAAVERAQEKVQDAVDKATNALQEISELQEEYSEWYESMPEQLQEGPTGEKLSEIIELDFDLEITVELESADDLEVPELQADLSELEELLDEAENADLPRGFGRD